MIDETVFIGYGGNLGDRQEYCDRAFALMNLLPHSQVTAFSSYYETEPVGPIGQFGSVWFYNGVVRLQTSLSPRRLYEVLRETERGLGRDVANRSGARTMDLDLLFYGQHIIDESDLALPHPRLHLRRFVLVPLAEIDRDWIHPVLAKSIQVLIAELDDPSHVRKLEVVPGAKYRTRPNCVQPSTPSCASSDQ